MSVSDKKYVYPLYLALILFLNLPTETSGKLSPPSSLFVEVRANRSDPVRHGSSNEFSSKFFFGFGISIYGSIV